MKFGVLGDNGCDRVSITTLNKNDVKFVLMNKQQIYSYPQVTNLSL